MADYDMDTNPNAQDQTFETDPDIWRINALRDSALHEEELREAEHYLNFDKIESKPRGYVQDDGTPMPMIEEPRFDSNNRVWYSGKRPRGDGDLTGNEYDPIVISLFNEIESDRVKPWREIDTADVIKLQEHLFEIGYLDNLSDIDGQYGPVTKGAAHRYSLNKPGLLDRIVNWWNKEEETGWWDETHPDW